MLVWLLLSKIYVQHLCLSLEDVRVSNSLLIFGVIVPFKQKMRRLYVQELLNDPFSATAADRRQRMFQRAMTAIHRVTPLTVVHAFRKAGPFIPFGPSLCHGDVEAVFDYTVL